MVGGSETKICFKNSITRSWFFLCTLEETGDGNVGRSVSPLL